MEFTNKSKLIFGLSAKATIINAIILVFISQLFWTLKFIQQIPNGVDIKSLPPLESVPWYYYIPISILAMIMALKWVEHTFDIKSGDYSWRAIKYKYIYFLLALLIISSFAKFLFLLLFVTFN